MLAERGSSDPLPERRARRGEPHRTDEDLRLRCLRPEQSELRHRLHQRQRRGRSQPLRARQSHLRGELSQRDADLRRDQPGRSGRDRVLRHLPERRRKPVQRTVERLPLLPERDGDRQRSRTRSLRLAGGGSRPRLQLPERAARPDRDRGRADLRRRHPGPRGEPDRDQRDVARRRRHRLRDRSDLPTRRRNVPSDLPRPSLRGRGRVVHHRPDPERRAGARSARRAWRDVFRDGGGGELSRHPRQHRVRLRLDPGIAERHRDDGSLGAHRSDRNGSAARG